MASAVHAVGRRRGGGRGGALDDGACGAAPEKEAAAVRRRLEDEITCLCAGEGGSGGGGAPRLRDEGWRRRGSWARGLGRDDGGVQWRSRATSIWRRKKTVYINIRGDLQSSAYNQPGLN